MKNLIATYVLLLALCAGLVGCLAPMSPGARTPEPQSVPQGSIGDILLKGLSQLNEGLGKATALSTELARSQQQYQDAVKNATKQADLNGNGKIDADERPLYYSLIASAISAAVAGGVSKLGDQKLQKGQDEHYDQIAALQAQLAALQAAAQPAPKP